MNKTLQDRFDQAVIDSTAGTLKNLFLHHLSHGIVPLAVWRKWGRQKYMAASNFVGFLRSAIEKTENAQLSHIAAALKANLADEEGQNRETGALLSIGSHEDWRQDFYTALGLNKSQLSHGPVFSETKRYSQTLEKLMQTPNVWEAVGAILAMEYSIGHEMDAIREGLDKTPELAASFSPNGKTGNEKKQINRNRKYVAHHAVHDTEQHFIELKKTIIKDFERLSESEKEIAFRNMQNGMNTIEQARTSFYDALLPRV